MATVFISYSGEQHEFAAWLRQVLTANGHEPWMDEHEVPGGSRFMEVILPAIERADIVLIVLSNSWVASAVCRQELEIAVSFNKRLIPVEPKRERLLGRPAALDGVSPIAFWRSSDKQAALDKLLRDINADHDWLKSHSELLVYARRWEESGKTDIRLRGDALRRAVRMVERANAGIVQPDLVPVQREYVRACEEAEAREIEHLKALNRRAVARQLLAEAQLVWIRDENDIDLALKLAIESLVRAPSSAARTLVRTLVSLLPLPLATLAGTRAARHVRFARDGRHIAVGCDDGVARVWSLCDHKLRLEVPHGKYLVGLQFDRNVLATIGGDGKARWTSVATGALLAEFSVEPRHAVLSTDAGTVVWARGQTTYVQRSRHPHEPALSLEMRHRVSGLAVSGSGRWVLVCTQSPIFAREESKYEVTLWDTHNGTTRQLDADFHMEPGFSPDERFVAARRHGGTSVWSVDDGGLSRLLRGELMAWADHDRVLLATTRLPRTDDPPAPRHGLELVGLGDDSATSLARFEHVPSKAVWFKMLHRPTVCVAAAAAVRVIDVRGGLKLAIVPHAQTVTGLAVSPDGDVLASTSSADELWLSSLVPSAGKIIGPFTAAIGAIAASDDGVFLARSLDLGNRVDIAALTEDLERTVLATADGKVEEIVVSRVGAFAAILAPWTVIDAGGQHHRGAYGLWVATDGNTTFMRRAGRSRSIAITRAGDWLGEVDSEGVPQLFRVSDPSVGAIRLFDVNGTETRGPPAAKNIAFDDTGRYVAAFGGGVLTIFERLGSTVSRVLQRAEITCWTFSGGEGRVDAVDTSGRLYSWHVARADAAPTVVAVNVTPSHLLPGPDDDTLVAVEGGVVYVLSRSSGRRIHAMPHLKPVSDCVRSPGGGHLLVSTIDGRLFVWQAATGELLSELDDEYTAAVWLTGERLAIRHGARFDVESVALEELLAAARARIRRPFTRDEWHRYLPDEPFPVRND